MSNFFDKLDNGMYIDKKTGVIGRLKKGRGKGWYIESDETISTKYDPYKGTKYERKYKSVYEASKDPNSAINKYIKEKKNEKTDDYEIQNISREAFEEEKTEWFGIFAKNKKTGITEGQLDYKIVNGKVKVDMIKVYDEFKRKGVATKMMKKLQNIAGDNDIYFELLTPDGIKLLDKIANYEAYRVGGHEVKYYKGKIKK